MLVCFFYFHKIVQRSSCFTELSKVKEDQEDGPVGWTGREHLLFLDRVSRSCRQQLGCTLWGGGTFRIHPRAHLRSGLRTAWMEEEGNMQAKDWLQWGDMWALLAFAMDREERVSEIFWLVSASWSPDISMCLSSQKSKLFRVRRHP